MGASGLYPPQWRHNRLHCTSGEAERTVSVDESVNETTVTGLTPFTEYTVSVAAENNVDIGVYSNMITIRTQGNDHKLVIKAEG